MLLTQATRISIESAYYTTSIWCFAVNVREQTLEKCILNLLPWSEKVLFIVIYLLLKNKLIEPMESILKLEKSTDG